MDIFVNWLAYFIRSRTLAWVIVILSVPVIWFLGPVLSWVYERYIDPVPTKQ